MKSHDKSKLHVNVVKQPYKLSKLKPRVTIARQLQVVDERQQRKNREAIKALVRCAHYLACHHVAHTTNYNNLVSLMVNCGSQPLTEFVEDASNNATYRSTSAVIGFMEAISV